MCIYCNRPGVTKWTILHMDHSNTVMLCKHHAEPVHAAWNHDKTTAHRYANPGTEQISRKWITAKRDVTPLDELPFDMDVAV